jgi:Stage II sporulation protein E (SpoIIE)
MECTWSVGRPRPSSEDRVSSSVSARVHCFIPGPSRVPGAQVTLGTNAEVAFCRSDYQAVVRHMSELAREMERQSGKEGSTSGRTCPDCGETIRAAKLIQTSLLPTHGLRKTPWTSRSASYPSPRVLFLLNERLVQRPIKGRFCSTLYALFNPVTRELIFSNAGMPLPLLVSGSACRELGEGGLASGMFPGSTYGRHVMQLVPGDCDLFATDGLHELRNGEGVEFCSAHVEEAWAQCRHKSATESAGLRFRPPGGLLRWQRAAR